MRAFQRYFGHSTVSKTTQENCMEAPNFRTFLNNEIMNTTALLMRCGFCFRSNDSTAPWFGKRIKELLLCPPHARKSGVFRLLRVGARQCSFDIKKRFEGLLSRCERKYRKPKRVENARNGVCKLTRAIIKWKVDFQAGERDWIKPRPNSLRTAEPTAFSCVFTPFSRFFNGFCLSWPVWVNFAKNKKSVGQNNRMYYNISLFPWVKAKSKVDCALT